jgi:hypothetical protein
MEMLDEEVSGRVDGLWAERRQPNAGIESAIDKT